MPLPQTTIDCWALVGQALTPNPVTPEQAEVFTCHTWRRLLPAIYAKLGELLCCAERSFDVDGEKIETAKGIKALTDLATWINQACMTEGETFFGAAAVIGNGCCGECCCD